MKKIAHVAMVATGILLSGCVSVQATKSPSANLAQYRTFAFYQPTNPSGKQLSFEQSPAGQTVRSQIKNDLAAKGISEAVQNPDFLVAYHSKTEQKMDVTDWGYPGYWWGGPGGVSVDEYTQGTLFIDFIDPKTNQVFWRGTATGVVSHPENPDTGKVASTVDKIMKKYPSELAAAGSRPAM